MHTYIEEFLVSCNCSNSSFFLFNFLPIFCLIFKGELKPKIEFISFNSQRDEILDFRRYSC